MTSTIGVKKIQHTNGTQVMTFDTDGKISSNVSSTGNITTTGTVNTPSINGGQIGGRRNVFINGAMQVFQRSTSASSLGGSAGYFTADRIRFKPNSTAGRFTSTKDSSAPNGFANSLKLDCTTADTSIGAGEYFFLSQKIEGQDLQHFAKGTSDAKPFTVSFYVKGNASATYTCELFDEDNTRQISKTFSVTTNWTRVELLFPSDTTGAFDNDNASSMTFAIWLHAGTNYTSGTLNSSSWASATTANRVSSSNTSFFDSTDRTFFLTGLQLETSSIVTPFEHRSFAEELALCQRYFEFVNGGIDAGMSVTTSSVQFVYRYRVDKRASATAALVGTPLINDGTQQSNINSVANTYHSFTSGVYLDLSTGTVNNNDTVLIYSNSATVGFSFDAEL